MARASLSWMAGTSLDKPGHDGWWTLSPRLFLRRSPAGPNPNEVVAAAKKSIPLSESSLILASFLLMRGAVRRRSIGGAGSGASPRIRSPWWGSPGEDRRHSRRPPRRPNPAPAGTGDERRARELKAAAAGAVEAPTIGLPDWRDISARPPRCAEGGSGERTGRFIHPAHPFGARERWRLSRAVTVA